MMKNVLLMTTKYPCVHGNEWLTNELAECFLKKDRNTTVLVLSWEYDDGPTQIIDFNGVKVYRLRLWRFFYRKKTLISILKISVFSFLARLRYNKLLRSADIIIATTPGVALWALLDFPLIKSRAKRYLILWDFFPYYMRDLWSNNKNKLFSLMLRWENRIYNSFDSIGCMTKGSIDFLKMNYHVENASIHLLPLWTKQRKKINLTFEEKHNIRLQYGLKGDSFISVYGGSMSVVQGLDNIIDLAFEVKGRREFQFVLIGKGPELRRLKNRVKAENIDNVVFIDQVPRDEYEKIISSCDLGLVSLSGKHAVPSFPSKSIDYLKVGLPILASIDRFTEFGSILKIEMKAGEWVVAGDINNFRRVFETMYADKNYRADCSINGRKYYEKQLNVNLAVEKIIEECESI